jgi:hypothetical protein
MLMIDTADPKPDGLAASPGATFQLSAIHVDHHAIRYERFAPFETHTIWVRLEMLVV